MKKRATLEVIAPTIEEAVANGLSQLGIPEEAVDVEVLDAGSRGLFGIGSRHARVRLTIKADPEEKRGEPAPPATPAAAATAEAMPGYEEPTITPEEEPWETVTPGEQVPVEETAPAAELALQDEYILEIARDTVAELLERMNVSAQVEAYYGQPDESRSRVPLCVDISGNDLSILIGRQAETLNALQYITSLIIGKELGHSLPLVVDVEGYRKRREQQLRQLARRMADQAIKTGRRQVLEPMPANERRIIHIELRENEAVTTESIGVEPRRKVTIQLKSS